MSEQVQEGQAAPDFTLPATGGNQVTLSQYQGKKVVLYFYSKDNTSGCTDEAREFRDMYEAITAAGAVILGVSKDSLETHEKFSAKHELPFLLLSDTDRVVCQLYGVFKEKNMYGKKVMGIERSTFIINEQGKITRVFRKVKVAGHAQAVLAALK
ncbi:thioredoxin-dependent thiol peroxidase [Sporomusa sp.]|uniref:thioredoxin-dependent thiol peroxidase n=1 Tax=Sporomusa sp. TaxID=2078658 RepID=UPI002BCF158D|nr:thioredoxin-dependent thiol peroxidase [Sporomusa sp.]HWR43767.1 thioredoxin-dependent thiol peroxidase [Sporomusa sp.]